MISDVGEDDDAKAFQAGREAAVGLAERLVLQTLIEFLAGCAEDPDAFRAYLQENALVKVAGVSGENLPEAFMSGVKEFAAEAVRAILAPASPLRH